MLSLLLIISIADVDFISSLSHFRHFSLSFDFAPDFLLPLSLPLFAMILRYISPPYSFQYFTPITLLIFFRFFLFIFIHWCFAIFFILLLFFRLVASSFLLILRLISPLSIFDYDAAYYWYFFFRHWFSIDFISSLIFISLFSFIFTPLSPLSPFLSFYAILYYALYGYW